MHTRTVVAYQRFRHEGSGFAVSVRHVVDHVLHFLNFVSFLHQRVEFNADFVLTRVGNFVVVNFHGLANRFQGVTHRATDIVEAIDRRNREVAAFHARTVTQVAAFYFIVSCPSAFIRRDFVHRALDIGLPVHFVKDEEFRLWAEEGGVAQTGRLQVSFCTLSDRARVAIIALHGSRLDDVATQDQGSVFGEGVQEAGAVFRTQDHVGFINAFPAFNRRAVKHLAVFKKLFIHVACRYGDVLLFTARVGETQVYPLNIMFFD